MDYLYDFLAKNVINQHIICKYSFIFVRKQTKLSKIVDF